MYRHRRSPSPTTRRPSVRYVPIQPRSPLSTTPRSSSFGIPASFARYTPRDHDERATTAHSSFDTRPNFPADFARYTPRDHDERATTAHSSFDTRPNPSSANRTSHQQSRPSYQDGRRSYDERATSPPGWPTEAVKLFLAVMCEGTERQYDRFQCEIAARHLALDLEARYNIRISAEELLRKYEILDKDYSEMIDARAGPREHGLIMSRHRERVRQRLLDEDRRSHRHEDRERGRQRERETEHLERGRREERERRERSSRPRRSDEPYYGRSPWSADAGRRQR